MKDLEAKREALMCYFVEEAIKNGEGVLSREGVLVVRTGEFTGRSPEDRFIVRDSTTENTVFWNNINKPLEPSYYEKIRNKMMKFIENCPKKYEVICRAGADPDYGITLRVVTEWAWHALFALDLFIPCVEGTPEWHVYCFPSFRANGKEDGIRQHNFVLINFSRKEVLIGGTGYAGEIKKSIFSVMNFLLPARHGVLSMHCAANVGKNGDTALFFGLSGTGKTSLSSDPDRLLVGDDEHGWSEKGIFNIEGGCYAKCINLHPIKERKIYNALKFGAVAENVVFHPGTRRINYADASITENTRAGYPITFVEGHVEDGMASHPSYIFFLCCDAYGVLPPAALLEDDQIELHFLSGYTSKVAGTEVGIKEPVPTFSTCFGAPFMPLPPVVYSTMLLEKVRKHRVKVWLINTGWVNGPFGVGQRIDINYTRRILSAILSGELNDRAEFYYDEVFHFRVPKHVREVPEDLMYPEKGWQDKDAYVATKQMLARKFIENFNKVTAGIPGINGKITLPDPEAAHLIAAP